LRLKIKSISLSLKVETSICKVSVPTSKFWSRSPTQTSLEDLEQENQKLKEKYNSLVCKLEERLRCPVCLEVPTTGPVYNCLYGHSVCSSCYTGYNSDCPQCRVKMYKITSLLAATVIGERFPADLLGIHHDQCNFRLVKCPALKCGRGI
jgi:hypothetical protein